MLNIETYGLEKFSEARGNSFNPDKISEKEFDFNKPSNAINNLSDGKFDFSDYMNTAEYNPENLGEQDTASENIKTRNEELEGKRHPKTNVPFERKTVEDADGNEVTGVFPEFDSEFDVQLPEDLYQESDKKQFAECNKQLKEAIEKNPELAKKFTPEQLEQIKNGETPDGYTWHHNEEKGKMQLVNSDTHAKTGHTGGKTVWGGGNENRLHNENPLPRDFTGGIL